MRNITYSNDLLCLVRVVCLNLETYDTVNVVASKHYILRYSKKRLAM